MICRNASKLTYFEQGEKIFQIRKLCKGNCQGMEERMQVKLSNGENSIEIELKTSYTFTLSAIKQN